MPRQVKSNAPEDANEPAGEPRRRRFEPGTPQRGMTPLKVRLLCHIAECGMLTTTQVARMAGMNKEAVTKHLRHLFDLKMVQRIAVPYASVAPPEANGSQLAFGPGQDIYTPTRAAIQYLERAQRISEEASARKLPDYGPRNALFLAHELLVRDVRVWLELCRTVHDGSVEQWLDGTAAHLPPARPDAWFQYRIPGLGTLVGFVEADRGTERGDQWEKKAREYSALNGSDTLAEATGGRLKGRVLVVTLTKARRDRLAGELARSPIASFTYVALVDDLTEGGLDRPVWRHQDSPVLEPLLSLPPLPTPTDQPVETESRVEDEDRLSDSVD